MCHFWHIIARIFTLSYLNYSAERSLRSFAQ
jgi:hypothetical protein